MIFPISLPVLAASIFIIPILIKINMGLSADTHSKRNIQSEKKSIVDDTRIKVDGDARNHLVKAIKRYKDEHEIHRSKDMAASGILRKEDWKSMKSLFDGKKIQSNKFWNLDNHWVTIEDKLLTQTILEAFGDDDKKKILTTAIQQPLIVSAILEMCNLPQTSGYRKINALIDAGLLIPMGHATTTDGKKVSRYVSVFDNFKIDIIKNKIIVKAKFGKDSFSTVKTVSTNF
jgi:hypothetical protein